MQAPSIDGIISGGGFIINDQEEIKSDHTISNHSIHSHNEVIMQTLFQPIN